MYRFIFHKLINVLILKLNMSNFIKKHHEQ